MTANTYNYTIKSLKGAKFYGKNNLICEIKGGYGLHVEGKGFILMT